jgi:Lrp/AsnC family transcriptional regulator
VIERRVAILNPESIGLGLSVFVEIETGDHSAEWLGKFADAVSRMPEVMEIYRMAGDVDYLLRIAVSDMAAYDNFYKKLIETVPLKNVTSRFAMERVKSTTAYPLPSLEARE